MSLTFNIYSFNFKFIYIWHLYIKKIPYLSYLEKERYKKQDLYNYTLVTDYKYSSLFIVFNVIWFFEILLRFLTFIIPIIDKYYVKYVTIFFKYFWRYSYNIISFILYIFSFPFIFIIFCYNCCKRIKGFFKYFIMFLKFLFNK
jgi:hypothetical protein